VSEPRELDEVPIDVDARVRASFARQAFMATLGARLATVSAGEVSIDLPFQDGLTQQHGFLHAGAVTSVMDSACGYAALTMMRSDVAVLTVTFTVNLLAPATGRSFRATGRVVRRGRTLTICRGELHAEDALVAIMQATMMAVAKRDNVID
jgi:uncharacterized protein (TIGR00369 family)